MVSIPQIIFLQNHGLIVNCENMEDALKLTEEVVLKCEKLCEVDLAKYRATTELIKYIGDDLVAYLSEDCILHNLLRKNGNFSSQKPSVPDTFVFCGVAPLDLKNLESQKPLQDYRDRFHDNPKIIIFDERCYFLAKNIKKAKEIEDVFKAHVLVLSSLQLDCAFLSDDEIAYLGNWEAEKYRMEK